MKLHKPASILLALGAEFLVWLIPALSFLWVYVGVFGATASAIQPHLLLISSLALACIGPRLLVEHYGALPLIRVVYQLVYSILLTALLLYYAIVAVGLESWGRVATWEMIRVYLDQWQHVAAVLQLPAIAVPLSLGAILLLVFLLVSYLQKHLQWPARMARFTRLRMKWVLLPSCLIPLAAAALGVLGGTRGVSGEPVMLSLNPGLGTDSTQNSRSEGAQILDRREAAAAARYVPGSLDSPRNVVLIVGDALRGDHMSLFGYERPTTPNFERLAKAGRLAYAERISSVCAESYCGLMSIARSKFVHEFSRSSLTLQQVLARHDYRVGFLLGGDHTNFYGLSDALGAADIYWDGSMSGAYVNDDREVVARAASLPEWDGRPVFLQFHLMSTHGLGLRETEFERYTPARNYYSRLLGVDEQTRRVWANNYYDNGMLQFDATIEDLLTVLEGRGYLDDAVVIVTGDHGEMLGETGHFGHAKTVQSEVLDIPLIVMRYGYRGQAFETPAFASQIDIAPTVLHELSLPIPSSWSGTRLQDPVERPFSFFQQGGQVGLLDFRDPERTWKFWSDTASGSLYAVDISADEGARSNRIESVDPALKAEWLFQVLPSTSTVGGQLLADSKPDDPANTEP